MINIKKVNPLVDEGIVDPTKNVWDVDSSKSDENGGNIKIFNPLVEVGVVELTENYQNLLVILQLLHQQNQHKL